MSEEKTVGRGDKHPGPEAESEPAFAVVDRRPGFEDPGAAAPETRYPSFVEELKARAEDAEHRAREISAAYRRIDEERNAFRERLTRDLERRVDIARAEFLRRIIPILDDFDRALQAGSTSTDMESLLAGVSLIRERLNQALAAEGVEPIETEGRPFDPTVAEAVAAVETDDPEADNIVVQEMERGYALRGTLLRPARVKVARARAGAPAPDPSD